MNVTVIEKPAFPVSTGTMVPRLQLLGRGAVSSERPSRLDPAFATHPPYEDEIADFDLPLWPEDEEELWTEAKNQRRCDLIDRKYIGSLTPGLHFPCKPMSTNQAGQATEQIPDFPRQRPPARQL
ncbi:MAG: hypothetical protein L0Z62_34270, partial [Gemmataceae bacterium]|nr:hypothetical protein [Gemmataceae bacterium]